MGQSEQRTAKEQKNKRSAERIKTEKGRDQKDIRMRIGQLEKASGDGPPAA